MWREKGIFLVQNVKLDFNVDVNKCINLINLPMFFIVYGCSFHVAHLWCNQGLFPRKKIGFDESFDVSKCLQQIEMPGLLHVCAYRNEQLSNIKTRICMFHTHALYSDQPSIERTMLHMKLLFTLFPSAVQQYHLYTARSTRTRTKHDHI